MRVTFLFRRLEEREYFAKKKLVLEVSNCQSLKKPPFFFVCFQIVSDRQEIVRKSSSVSKEIRPLSVYDR